MNCAAETSKVLTASCCNFNRLASRRKGEIAVKAWTEIFTCLGHDYDFGLTNCFQYTARSPLNGLGEREVNVDLFQTGALRRLRDYLNTHPRAEHYASAVLIPIEAVIKKPLFGCQECGQCLLHENGMVCPMRCPKNLRNGPCGGVRANGHCEVYPERWCVWYRAYYQSQKLPIWREHIYEIHRPVNWQLFQNSSSWINMLSGRDDGIKPTSLAKAPAANPPTSPKAAA